MVPNQVYGILVLILCTICCMLSRKYFIQNQDARSLAFIIFVGLTLRVYCSFDLYLHTWDERYHALVAKNLINHPLVPTLYDNPLISYDYKDWTRNHIWLHKQPLTLMVIAISLKSFGCNEIALRLPSILLSTIAILLVFEVGKYYCSRKAAFIGAFLFSINGLIIELSSGRVPTDHVDSFFLFFILLSIFLVIRFSQTQNNLLNIFSGIALGLSVLCKWLPAFIVAPIWLLVIFASKKYTIKEIVQHFILFVSVAVIVFLPWQIYIHYKFPQENAWEMAYNTRHLFEPIENHSGSIFYFIDKIRINYSELIYLPLIYFLYSIYKQPSDVKKWSMFIWIFVPLVFFSFAKTKMQGYIAFTSPALFLITGNFINWLENNSFERKLMIVGRKLIIFGIYILAVRYSIERVKPFDKANRNPLAVRELKSLNGVYQKAVLFNYDDPISAMFYTNLVSYSELPNDSVLKRLQNSGYKILINDPSHSHQSKLSNIHYLKLESLIR